LWSFNSLPIPHFPPFREGGIRYLGDVFAILLSGIGIFSKKGGGLIKFTTQGSLKIDLSNDIRDRGHHISSQDR
jgi:hypothetical protein